MPPTMPKIRPPSLCERGMHVPMLLDALRQLVTGEHTPGNLARHLGCSRRTVERLLRHALPSAGIVPVARRDGIHVYYSLPEERLRRVLGLGG